MNDNSIMPYGLHKGKKLANVPASYLLYLFSINKLDDDLRKYVLENMDVLKKEKE